MNEEKLNQLMKSYGDALGTCSRTPAPAPSPSPWPRRRVMLIAAATVTVFGLGVTLWPRDAVAGSLQRIGFALKNASTMETISSMATRSGAWQVFTRSYYKDGNWRFQNREGMPLEVTHVLRGDKFLTDYKTLDHATLEKADASYIDVASMPNMSALDFIKRKVDTGRVGIERKITLGEHAPVNGRPAYTILMDRKEDDYHAEIVVDKATDLPISCETRVSYGARSDSYREEYKFNEPLDDSLFVLESPKPIVDYAKAQPALITRWQRPIAEIGETQIRDARVTPDGTIWIAVTTKDGAHAKTLPSALRTTDGETYVRMIDVVPSAILSKDHPFTFNGEELVIVGFIPLNPNAKLPNKASIDFALRSAHYPGFSAPQVNAPEKSAGVVGMYLTKETGPRPFYFPAIDLDHFGFQVGLLIWDTRAKALEKDGNLLLAAKAYEQTAVEYRTFVPYAGYRSLESAAKCYRQLGMKELADQTDDRAKRLKETGRM